MKRMPAEQPPGSDPGTAERDPESVTLLLRCASRGETPAKDALAERVFDRLHAIAARRMRGQSDDHTLQPTALVSEAWIRLFGRGLAGFDSREHFFCAASTAMRHVLVDYARRKRTNKRTPGGRRIDFDAAYDLTNDRELDFALLEQALVDLETRDAGLSRLVELRFFGGLRMEEIADVLQVRPRTLDRRWKAAKEWLRQRLT
jgi:RNA polymerase sigma factor (TIGR02999 family)